MKAKIYLEDGFILPGELYSGEKAVAGEFVFNTSMTGYQEILTDPSYNGQIVTMTYPLIGNYGFNEYDSESYKVHADAFVVKAICEVESNFRSSLSPKNFFLKNNVTVIHKVDTRALTKHIRQFGSMIGVICSSDMSEKECINKINMFKKEKRNLVDEVSIKETRHLPGNKMKIVVYDLGIKENIVRLLKEYGFDITVVPHSTSWMDIMDMNVSGVLLSNGPGDPMDIPEVVENVKNLIGKIPLVGICLGHQILGLALGGRTYKLKFGHHGSNHPVKDLLTNKVYITSQNHNYALDTKMPDDVEMTHINVNDKTCEGLRCLEKKVLSVQYHPEASPGPQDSHYIFDDFMKFMEVKNATE